MEQLSASFGAEKEADSKLRALFHECSEANWDGYDAEPVSPLAANLAEEFILSLPDDIPLPELSAEPDGSISLDWIISRQCLYSLSLGTNQYLAYAWLDGTDRGHAVAEFDRVKVPARVLEGIRGVTANGDAAIRVA